MSRISKLAAHMNRCCMVRGDCAQKMRKDCVYKLIIHLGSDLNIISTQCGCPAGKGPIASCKHIGVLCHCILKFKTQTKSINFRVNLKVKQTLVYIPWLLIYH